MDAISFEVEGDGSILPLDRGEIVKAPRRFGGLDRRGHLSQTDAAGRLDQHGDRKIPRTGQS